jgi:hypothetical protein
VKKTAALLAGLALALACAIPAAADPATGTFSFNEYDNLANENSGHPGWGDSLNHVESACNCVGTWDAYYGGTWGNGHELHTRLFKSGVGEVHIDFAKYATAPKWRMHDWLDWCPDSLYGGCSPSYHEWN